MRSPLNNEVHVTQVNTGKKQLMGNAGEMIEPTHSELSIKRQCQLLNLNRSTYYASCATEGQSESDDNLEFMNLIDKEYTRHPFYGSRKMTAYLRNLGYPVNRKRIQRLMRKMGIQSVAPKPNTSLKRTGHKIYPYRLAGLGSPEPIRSGAQVSPTFA